MSVKTTYVIIDFRRCKSVIHTLYDYTNILPHKLLHPDNTDNIFK